MLLNMYVYLINDKEINFLFELQNDSTDIIFFHYQYPKRSISEWFYIC